MKKEEALQHITVLLEKIHTSAQEDERAFLKVADSGYQSLRQNCLELMEKVVGQSDHVASLTIDGELVGAVIMDLELQYAALQGRSRRKLAIFGVISFMLVALVLWFCGAKILALLKNVFGETVTGTSKVQMSLNLAFHPIWLLGFLP
jgi:hypothetical protein